MERSASVLRPGRVNSVHSIRTALVLYQAQRITVETVKPALEKERRCFNRRQGVLLHRRQGVLLHHRRGVYLHHRAFRRVVFLLILPLRLLRTLLHLLPLFVSH